MPLWQLVIIQALTFIALILALRVLFARNLDAALKRLQALQEEALLKEAQLKEELLRAKQERLAEIERGRDEANRLLEEARREVEALQAGAAREAREESEKILSRGKEEMEKARANLLAAIEADALQLATEAVKRTFTQQGKEDFHRHLIDALVEEIANVGKERFPARAKAVRVTSSFPLTADERHRLRRVLSEKVGAEVALEERIDLDLITGLVVEIGALVMDGSLKNRLRKVIPLLRNQAA